MATSNRARKTGQGSKWCRPSTRMALYLRDGFRCSCCDATTEDGAMLTLDHIISCEDGGSNDAANLVTMCRACNSAKQALSQRAWLRYLREVRGWTSTQTTRYSRRVRRLVARPLNRVEGRRLAAMRRAA